MKVSVIVPCYNLEKHLSGLFASIIKNNHRDIEFILINDASRDQTLALLEKFKLENNIFNLKVIDSKKNMGISHVRNLGMELAQGEYLYFLDGDDRLADNFASIFDFLAAEPLYYFSNKKFIKSKKMFGHNLHVSMSIFQKKFLLTNNLKFLPNVFFEDNYFAAQLVDLFQKSKKIMATIDFEPFFYTSGRENSIMNSAKSLHDIKMSMDSIMNLKINPALRSLYSFQLFRSFMRHAKRRTSKLITGDNAEEIVKFLQARWFIFKKDFSFSKAPILWKVRFILYKFLRILV